MMTVGELIEELLKYDPETEFDKDIDVRLLLTCLEDPEGDYPW